MMDQWLQIRQRVLREGVSKRQILRETGMRWTTLEKILKYPVPPGYCRTKPPKKSKIGPCLERISQFLEQDHNLSAHQKGNTSSYKDLRSIVFRQGRTR